MGATMQWLKYSPVLSPYYLFGAIMQVVDNLKKYSYAGTTLPQQGGILIFLKNQLQLISQAINLLVTYANTVNADPVTVANLPTASTTIQGVIACVTDAHDPDVGDAPTGGGSTVALVWCNGTEWLVLGS